VFPDTKVILLEQNYRSTRNIIEAANALIAHNDSRRGKTLWSSNQMGRKVAVHELADQEKEAVFVAENILNLVTKFNFRYRDFAVLYRTKAQSNILENVFSKSAVPHRLLSGIRFYDHAEVKDIISYLRFIHNTNDIVSLKRIINVPRRGIGDATVEKIQSLSQQTDRELFDIIENCAEFDEIRRNYSKLSGFTRLIRSLQDFANDHLPSETVGKVIEDSGYMETLAGEENEERRKNVEELISSALLYEEKAFEPTLSGFLEELALVSDIDNYDETSNSVVLMTVHAAKGLEFPVVFLVGMEENLFPSPRSTMNRSDLEEERRLAYVAMTRAKSELYITHCHQRTLYGRTGMNPISRFIKEIPENLLNFVRMQPAANRSYQNQLDSSMKIFSVPSFEKRAVSKPNFPSLKKEKESFVLFQNGDRVIHAIFGSGTILEAKSYGGDILYRIRFDNAGEKKLMATYAKLKKGS